MGNRRRKGRCCSKGRALEGTQWVSAPEYVVGSRCPYRMHADLGRRGVEVRRRAETKLRSGPLFQNQHRSVAARTQPGNALL
jgi:hypothetical protein